MSETIETIILREDRRGISAFAACLGSDYCTDAARFILARPGTVFIVTGFYILKASAPETDGPPGAAALGSALAGLGYRVYYVTDIHTAPVMEALVDREDIILFDITDEEASRRIAGNLIEQYRPGLVISIERCGRTAQNDYRNCRDESILAFSARTDCLFFDHPCTIGIGDGGNEIGMGNISSELLAAGNMVRDPCVVKASRLILASVSNWGAYGLIAALSLLKKRNLLPDPELEYGRLRTAVGAGAVDGITGERKYCVDGLDSDTYLSVLRDLHSLVNGTIHE